MSSAKLSSSLIPPEISTKKDAVEKALESGEPKPDSEDAPTEPSVKGEALRIIFHFKFLMERRYY